MAPDMVKYAFFGLVILAVVFEVVGDIFFKKWSMENRTSLLLFGLFIYFIGSVLWAVSLKYEFLSKAILVFTVLNMVAVTLIGIFIFKEDLSVLNKAGIALGVLSVILIEI